VVESWIDQIHQVGADTQAIAGWNGPGPMLIRNNYLEAAGENVIFGGTTVAIPNMNPSDITIERNHFFKPYTWRVGHPTYAGTHWLVKNLMELKTGVRVLIEGNVMENCWGDAQQCAAFILTPDNFSGGGRVPWAQVSDVTIRYNHIIRAEGGAIRGNGGQGTPPPTQPGQRYYVHDNLFEDVGAGSFGGAGGGAYFVFSSGPLGLHSLRFEHNTLINDPQLGPAAAYSFEGSVTSPILPFPNGISFHDNIMGAGATPNAPRDADTVVRIDGRCRNPVECL
jgi:hypothetical protein